MKKYSEDPKITAFALGELHGIEAEEIRRQMETDAELKKYVEDIQRTAFSLSTVLRQEEQVPLKRELRDKLHELSAPKKTNQWMWLALGSGLTAAGLALVFGLENFNDSKPLPAKPAAPRENVSITAQMIFRHPPRLGQGGGAPAAGSVASATPVSAEPTKEVAVAKPVVVEDHNVYGTKKTQGGLLIADSATIGAEGAGGKKGSVTGMSSVHVELGGLEEEYVGTMDRDAVRRVIRSQTNEIRGCYEVGLLHFQKSERPVGKVILSWTITEGGRAQKVKVKASQLANQAVEKCLQERIASWHFPEPPPGLVAEVTYPILFVAGN